MNFPKHAQTPSFWKIYAFVMIVDLMLYILVFHVGKAIPAPPDASAPGNMGLIVAWLFAHAPAAFLYTAQVLSESFLWLLVLQDAWIAGLIYLWRRRGVRTAPKAALQ
jgi:Na+-driven multidrug efflux pump